MSRQSYTEQSRCAVKLVASLLDRARALGIYDSSLIIVSSDHGTDLQPLGFSGTERKPVSRSRTLHRATAGDASTRKSRDADQAAEAHRPDLRCRMRRRRTSICRRRFSMFSGSQAAAPDAVMFRRDAAQPRTRTFGMYNPHVRFPKEYLDRVDVLTIDGRVLDAAAWNVQRLIWRPDLRLEAATSTPDRARAICTSARVGRSSGVNQPATAGEITFVQPLTVAPIISASLPTGAGRARPARVIAARTGPRSAARRSRRPTSRIEAEPWMVRTATATSRSQFRRNPSRPPVSEITLHFDSGGRDEFEFKLDRLMIR